MVMLKLVPVHLILDLPKPFSETMMNALQKQCARMAKQQVSANLRSFAYHVVKDGPAVNMVTLWTSMTDVL